MRDTRYLLTRRQSKYGRTPSHYFWRTDAEGFSDLDRWTRQVDDPKLRVNCWPYIYVSACYAVVLIALVYGLISYASHRPPPEPEPTSYQLARDAAARERAAAFVRALGFKPGPAVCRAKRDGSAWCTIRVAESDKTFALWCSRRHPTCIENLPRE